MNLSYFFRRTSPVYHSIENQFFAIQKEMPEGVKYENKFAKYHSKGFFKRIFITIHSAFRQGDVNHITGDIHFVAAFFRKKKTILTIHDIGSTLNGGGIKVKVLRFLWFTMPFARVKYVTVISEFTKKEILQNFKINPNKIRVIPDCVSPEFVYSQKEFNSEKPKILQIGTKSNKNLQNLIPALDGIYCKLIIVGKLSDKQIKLLEKYKIDFENKYDLSQHEIIKLYKDSDFVTFVSTYEGFGVPVLEAQATGRVVLSSNISPMKEVAGDGAILVDPYDVNDIKAKIIEIIENKNLRDSVVSEGLNNVKKYSAKAVAVQYAELYHNVIKTNM